MALLTDLWVLWGCGGVACVVLARVAGHPWPANDTRKSAPPPQGAGTGDCRPSASGRRARPSLATPPVRRGGSADFVSLSGAAQTHRSRDLRRREKVPTPQPSDGSRTVGARIERPGCDPPSRTGGWRLCAPGSTPTRPSLQSFQSRRPAPRQPAHASRQTRREPGRAAPHAARNDHNFATPRLPAGGREETGAQSAPTVQPPAIKRAVGKLWRSPG
jgi:hypothetical protein